MEVVSLQEERSKLDLDTQKARRRIVLTRDSCKEEEHQTQTTVDALHQSLIPCHVHSYRRSIQLTTGLNSSSPTPQTSPYTQRTHIHLDDTASHLPSISLS